MQQPTGFEYQSAISGACGKYALQHALLLLGIPITQKDAARATGVPPYITAMYGTDEKQLKRGLRYFGCRAEEFASTNASAVRKKVDALLNNGCPVIMSLRNDNHWAVLAGREGNNRYYWIDSAPDCGLIGHSSWAELAEEAETEMYYIIGVVPKKEPRPRNSLVRRFGQVYPLLSSDEDLRGWWGYYLEDLREIFDNPVKKKKSLSAKAFFKRYGNIAHSAACHFYFFSDEAQLSWELKNYRTVAEAHGLLVSEQALPEAIARFSAALTCLACLE